MKQEMLQLITQIQYKESQENTYNKLQQIAQPRK